MISFALWQLLRQTIFPGRQVFCQFYYDGTGNEEPEGRSLGNRLSQAS